MLLLQNVGHKQIVLDSTRKMQTDNNCYYLNFSIQKNKQVMKILQQQLILNVILIQVDVLLVVKEVFQIQNHAHHTENTTYEQSSKDAGDTATSKCKVRSSVETLQLQPMLNVHSSEMLQKQQYWMCWLNIGHSLHLREIKQLVQIQGIFNTSDCVKKKCRNISGKHKKECNDGKPQFITINDPLCVFDGTSCIYYGKLCNVSMELNRQGNIFVQNCPSKQRNMQASEKLLDIWLWIQKRLYAIQEMNDIGQANVQQLVDHVLLYILRITLDVKSKSLSTIATVNSHAQHQHLAGNCTISSARCITISICSSYKTQLFVADLTHKNGVARCVWDATINKCKDKVCSDTKMAQLMVNIILSFRMYNKWIRLFGFEPKVLNLPIDNSQR
ncbi:unnamed protein product [Paramecium pentaurelia]|uniref:Uncharacterized protein n=1 Tax=Paramecium pentaurelia TaxID=43138 RepID=A0A8S1XLN0_9CILI|nr:unnamed protein product [Paramecium pentaurelia]